MTQEQVNLILGILAFAGPILVLVTRDWLRKRKNKLDYGDNLLDAMNKTTESLKAARSEIQTLDTQLNQQDKSHEQEINDLQHQHKRERERLRERITALERKWNEYDISFTLKTHPELIIENLKVSGKEDVSASQKLKAITPQQVEEAKKKK